MTIREKITDVLKSRYLSIDILKDVQISPSLISKIRKRPAIIGRLPLNICERLLRAYHILHALKQRRHNERGIASVKDIKDKLRNPWEYAIYYPDGHIHIVRRIQPEVHHLSYQEFTIKTPYMLAQGCHLTYILVKRQHVWFLATYPSQNNRSWLKSVSHLMGKRQIKRIKRYLKFLMTKFQVNELPSGNCYIPILNRSIQDAYYRLSSFEISYYSALVCEARK